ncbi:transporter [Bacillus pseudomycoides]|uniref:Transporter n=1 Tax=Bacillus pseudomycoides TaxID=64104 RepID=A0AAJ2DQV1_9BACI|nr:transporter [Bacillus pseudomycoides]MDR4329757.1 transporter [Bacillus pseudomycoides]
MQNAEKSEVNKKQLQNQLLLYILELLYVYVTANEAYVYVK